MAEIFHFMTSDDLRLLAEKSRRKHYGVGDVIVTEATEPRGIYVLQSGRVKVEKTLVTPPIRITELIAGEVFGEMSFIDCHPASASVIALEFCEVDFLEKSDVMSLLSSVPGFSSRFYQSLANTLSERLRRTTDSLACI